MKEIVRYLFIILISFLNIILLFNYSSYEVTSEKYIKNSIEENTNIIDIIYSKKFNKNKTIIKVRKKVDKIVSIGKLINKEDIIKQDILNSTISKQIVSTMAINIVNSIRDNKYYSLYELDDYYYLLDNNIDNIIESANIPLLYNFKSNILDILKDLGEDIIKDIPSTYKITKRIPNYKYNIMHYVINYNNRKILISIDIILFILLIILYRNKIINNLIIILIISIIFTFIIQIYLLTISNSYINEWSFIKIMFKDYINKTVTLNIFMIIILIIISSYKVIKNKKAS